MVRCRFGWLITLSVLGVFAGWQAPSAAGEELVWQKCWMLPLKHADVRCGRLHIEDPVPVSLPVVILQHDSPAPSETAMLYLQGGPGGNSWLGRYEFNWHFWVEDAALTQDLVLYDQRGTGLSDPSLICDEIRVAGRQSLGLGRFSEGAIALHAKAMVDCHSRLVTEGHDLAQFTTMRNAADVVALMESLPYSDWTLFGASYGTRLALEVMRMRPDLVRNVVLDGVLPPDLYWWLEEPAILDDVIAKIDGVCSWWRMQRPDCDRYAGDFVGSLDTVLARLAEEPHRVLVEDWSVDGDPTIKVRVDAPVLLSALHGAMGIPDGANLARDAILQAARRDYAMIDQLLQNWAYASLQPGIHEPVFLSVLCDIDSDWTEEDFNRRASASRYYGTHFPQPSFLSPCGYWTSSRAAPEMREPVISSIPTLLISGEYDPLTPSSWGDRVLAGLENGHHFIIPRGGHVALMENRCAMRIMAAFLSDPTVRPDAQCLDEVMPGVRRE